MATPRRHEHSSSPPGEADALEAAPAPKHDDDALGRRVSQGPRRLSSGLMSTARSIPHDDEEEQEEAYEESVGVHSPDAGQDDNSDLGSPAPSSLSGLSSSSFSSSPLSRSRAASRPLRKQSRPPTKPTHPRPCVRNCGLLLFALGLIALGVAVLSHTVLPSLRDKQVALSLSLYTLTSRSPPLHLHPPTYPTIPPSPPNQKQALKLLVIDSTDHPSYLEWAEGRGEGGDSPLHLHFYFFHLVNGAAFLGGATPQYEEKGPYVFEQKARKVDVSFSEDGTQVSYVQLTQSEFVPALSGTGLKLTVRLPPTHPPTHLTHPPTQPTSRTRSP